MTASDALESTARIPCAPRLKSSKAPRAARLCQAPTSEGFHSTAVSVAPAKLPLHAAVPAHPTCAPQPGGLVPQHLQRQPTPAKYPDSDGPHSKNGTGKAGAGSLPGALLGKAAPGKSKHAKKKRSESSKASPRFGVNVPRKSPEARPSSKRFRDSWESKSTSMAKDRYAGQLHVCR